MQTVCLFKFDLNMTWTGEIKYYMIQWFNEFSHDSSKPFFETHDEPGGKQTDG